MSLIEIGSTKKRKQKDTEKISSSKFIHTRSCEDLTKLEPTKSRSKSLDNLKYFLNETITRKSEPLLDPNDIENFMKVHKLF